MQRNSGSLGGYWFLGIGLGALLVLFSQQVLAVLLTGLAVFAVLSLPVLGVFITRRIVNRR